MVLNGEKFTARSLLELGGPRLRAARQDRTDSRPSAPIVPEVPLGAQVEVHDKQQLEIRINYGLRRDPDAQLFKVDTYFFVPRNVGVSKTNYSREQFYGDVTALMRLDAAALPLDKLADPSFSASPLHRIAEGLEQFQKLRRPPASQPIAVHVKLYAYVHTEAVRNEIRVLREQLEQVGPDPAAREALVRALDLSLDRIRASLVAYRRIRTAFWPYEKLCHRTLVEAMRWADEYMSLFLEERLAALTVALDENAPRLEGSCLVARIRATISELAAEEAEHRRRYGYLTLEEGDGQHDNREYFTYRMSLLKKAVHQALYLDAREVHADSYLRNAVGAVGAALAAIWALATQLPSAVAGLPSTTKLLFMSAAVAGYVAKDRIKALSNEYLTRQLRRHDHTSWIHSETLQAIGLGMLRARLRESMHFLTWDDTREEIRRIRLERRTVRGIDSDANEEVIHYRKSLLVESEDHAALPEGYGVRDILRFNVRHFLVRLDDPSDKVRYYDPDRASFAEAKLPKVYHLNVVLRVRRMNEDEEVLDQRFEHLRVVLNKNGIVRVEHVG
jgi:hypothetical protein